MKAYVYSEFGSAQYGSGWSLRTQSLPQKLSALNPQIEVDYGIIDSLEVDLYVSEVSWWETSGEGQPASNANGVGDTTAFLKPGGFARYVYREEMFPSVVFRRAYDAIQTPHHGLKGDLKSVGT